MMMEEVDLADTPLRPQLENQDSIPLADDEPPDPRIQVELERLNTSTDLINKLEVDLDEGRMMFRQTLLESTQRIDSLTKKLGKCIDQARPYYDARIKAKQCLTEAQKSAVRYERAVSQHNAAREMVQLAEEGLLTRGCVFDSTWQEMLNHATTKVNDAEREKIESTGDHKVKSNLYDDAETRVKVLQKELKRAIAKSSLNARRSLLQLNNLVRMHQLQLLPYFELKAAVNQKLEEQKRHVRELEEAVASAKNNYSQALANLETISDQIHKTRQNRFDLGIRGVGVGAESPAPPFSVEGHESKLHFTSSDEPDTCIKNQMKLEPTSSHPLQQADSMKKFKEENSITPNEPNSDCSSNNLASGFSSWQFVGYSTPSSVAQNLLSVEDRESIISDSESLTSMEMLSEEAIANLMLEDEIQEASLAIISPQKDEFLEPPFPKSSDTGGNWELVAKSPSSSTRPQTLPINEACTNSNSSSSTGDTPAYLPLCNTPDTFLQDI